MTAAAAKRQVTLTSRSRPLRPGDLARFDYIVGMDPRNTRVILVAAAHWADAGSAPPLDAVRPRVTLMTQYLRGAQKGVVGEVPDPYYGGSEGFETVLDLLDDACGGLLEHITSTSGGGGGR